MIDWRVVQCKKIHKTVGFTQEFCTILVIESLLMGARVVQRALMYACEFIKLCAVEVVLYFKMKLICMRTFHS